MRANWKTAWYAHNAGRVVDRLRYLAQANSSLARRWAQELEKDGWGPWWELLRDVAAPYATCPVCKGEGVMWAHHLAQPWEVPLETRDDWWADCPKCKGEGLVPFPVGSWEETCPRCRGEGGHYDYYDTRYPPDNPPWVECELCGGLGKIEYSGPYE